MNQETERIPLKNMQAEMSVLSVLLSDKDAAAEIVQTLQPETFTKLSHRVIFEAAKEIAVFGMGIDIVTIQARLNDTQKLEVAGGASHIIEVSNFAPNPDNWNEYANIIEDLYKLRLLEAHAAAVLGIVHDPSIDSTDEKIESVHTSLNALDTRKAQNEQESIGTVVREIFQDVDRAITTGVQTMPGISTGYPSLDAKLGGLRKGGLYIIGARPAMGKTALVMNVATAVAKTTTTDGMPQPAEPEADPVKRKQAVCVIQLEVSRKEATKRALSSVGGFPVKWLEGIVLNEDDYQRVSDAAEELHGLSIDIRDTTETFTMAKIRASVSKTKRKYGHVDLIIVDYLQLMGEDEKGSDSNRSYAVKRIANGLKAYAKKMDVPVVVLAQLSRGVDSRDNKRPLMSDLGESGGIEAAADVVAMIYRQSYYDVQETGGREPDITEAEIIIRKNRQGETGTVALAFQGAYVRFKEIT